MEGDNNEDLSSDDDAHKNMKKNVHFYNVEDCVVTSL